MMAVVTKDNRTSVFESWELLLRITTVGAIQRILHTLDFKDHIL
jgi:hypothetical protein